MTVLAGPIGGQLTVVRFDCNKIVCIESHKGVWCAEEMIFDHSSTKRFPPLEICVAFSIPRLLYL